MANPYAELAKELKVMRDDDYRVGKNATPLPLDFEGVVDSPDEPSGHMPIPLKAKVDNDGYLLTKNQTRSRVRRKQRRGEQLTAQEAKVLYKKPLEDWDSEELARGRPRNKDGSFRGARPEWVSMAMHEEAIDRFTKGIKTELGVATITAMEKVNEILQNDETDYRGKPVVSASTKLDAAKFLIEHMVGKPKQHIEQDVSIKLQAILGSVIVNPGDDLTGYEPAHMPGVTMELATMEAANVQSD